MTWLTRSLAGVLVVAFTATVHGASTCLTGSSAQCNSGPTFVDFTGCDITDDDLADLHSCLDSIGRARIVDLDLTGNELTTIPPDLFELMDALTVLSLQRNTISTIDVAAFAGLASLDTLYFHENALTTIQAGLFDGLSSLQILWLQRNTIGSVEAGSFAGLTALNVLFLHENEVLTTVQAGLFKDLGSLLELRLNINAIGTVDADAFTGLTSLETLRLNDNMIETLDAGVFNDLASLEKLRLNDNLLETLPETLFAATTSLLDLEINNNLLETLPANIFATLVLLDDLEINENQLQTLPADAFAGLGALTHLEINGNQLQTLPAGVFAALGALVELEMSENQLQTLPADVFAALGALEELEMQNNQFETLPSNLFAALGSLEELELNGNLLSSLPVDAFTGLPALQLLLLNENALTTLPAGIFESIGSASEVRKLNLDDNSGLQCVPTATHASASANGEFPSTANMCECTPATAVTCGTDEVCTPGEVGYNCVPACTLDSECDTDNGEVCCQLTNVCEASSDIDAGACGDPHMTGFRGQKFDFAGKENGWYAVVSDLPHMHLNMRVTAPVPSVPEITYITGISIITKDSDGLDHTIVISVADPHNLESSCPVGISHCLADGALHVVVDGEKVLLAPGEVWLASDVAISAVNLPGACRSFGFEKYWERKKMELLTQSGRRLGLINTMQDMSEWVLADPTVTNIAECTEYVALATAEDEAGMISHQSEHVSFQIMTPTIKLRLSHGRLHQLPVRDPTDTFDLPDHLTWQMNMAIDHHDMSRDATGILGETLVPTVDDSGAPIMQGMGAIRGMQEDYRVKGPLGLTFSQAQRHE